MLGFLLVDGRVASSCFRVMEWVLTVICTLFTIFTIIRIVIIRSISDISVISSSCFKDLVFKLPMTGQPSFFHMQNGMVKTSCQKVSEVVHWPSQLI